MSYRYLVNHYLEDSADATPDKAAVVDGERTITYGELEARSNQVANLLIELGVRRGDRVGIFLRKSMESVVGIYGVMKAGACYVPLDPGAPDARIGYIAGNCGIRHLVTGTEKRRSWATMRDEGADQLAHLVVLNAADSATLPRRRRDDGVGGRRRRPPIHSPARHRHGPAGPGLHPLHVGVDRHPEGGDAQPSRLPRVRRLGRRGVRPWSPTTWCRATRRSTSTCPPSTCTPPPGPAPPWCWYRPRCRCSRSRWPSSSTGSASPSGTRCPASSPCWSSTPSCRWGRCPASGCCCSPARCSPPSTCPG